MTARIRILVVAGSSDTTAWSLWEGARQASAYAPRMVLQRVSNAKLSDMRCSVGLGYGETLRWFGPVECERTRGLIIKYAAAVVDAADFPPMSPQLSELALPSEGVVSPEPTAARPKSIPISRGIVLLSHAETDLLALERARADLPQQFPAVAGFSLNGLTDPESLLKLFGVECEPQLLAIVRVHGAAASVPGLAELIERAQEKGWAVAVISGVGASVESLPRTSNVACEFVSNLTSYFLAGGPRNIAQALRYAARECLGLPTAIEPPREMPAHGLYHPDLLVTSDREWDEFRVAAKPTAIVIFYRAHVLSGNLDFVDEILRALERRGFAAVGVFTRSLRDCSAFGAPIALGLLTSTPDLIVNTVSYPVLTRTSLEPVPPATHIDTFEALGAPQLQAICCGTPRAEWIESARGLSPTEAAMNIALPECDGRVITVPVSFKESHRYVPDTQQISRVADIARRFAVLRRKRNSEKRIAVVLTNSGGKAQQIGCAVGLDTPASLLRWLVSMREQGYDVGELPDSPDALMLALAEHGCYDDKYPVDPAAAWRMPRVRYSRWFRAQAVGFQQSLTDVWGEPSAEGSSQAPPFWRSDRPSLRGSPLLALREPHTDRDDYLFCGLKLGNVFLTIQPPRSYGVDAEVAYHATDLPPCHHYAAFYRWLADVWQADALIHFGTHGTLEWLPGKSFALSPDCAPDALLGDVPLFYPFVVNNPGEGAQAKRRSHAVIIDHLVPPLTHAENYGSLATLARLVEEYYRAEALDPGKLPVLRTQVWDLLRTANLEGDLREIRRVRHGNHEHPWDDRVTAQGIPRALDRMSGRGFAHLLEDLDAYLCDLGRAQIRGGLHVFGSPPVGAALIDLVFAILRSPNATVPSLVDGVTRACGIQPSLLRDCQGRWPDPVSEALSLDSGAGVTVGQIRSAIEDLARQLLQELALRHFDAEFVATLVAERFGPAPARAVAVAVAGIGAGAGAGSGTGASAAVTDVIEALTFACEVLVPNIARTTDETRYLLAGLNGEYVPAGPSGAPSRGMAHVLPTGRNFYTVDPRGLPTPAAWATGQVLASTTVAQYFTETGEWPESIAMSIWGTPTMRTGGDEIAQALALIGARPLWEPETRRACGFEVVPLAELGRPRIDVTLRVSGFFRDAFPELMYLFGAAIERVQALDEPTDQNYVRKHWLAATSTLVAQGRDTGLAQRQASYRVFSSQPGGYGTGLLQLVEQCAWAGTHDLANAAISSGSWAYTAESSSGVAASEAFERQLGSVELVLHSQDSREQDLFDSSDYFEYHGGLVAAVAALSNRSPRAYFGDSSDPAQPHVRTLRGEALRVYRSRVVNPKWLRAMQRHGYRGGLEMATTVDSVFGFAATTGIVTDWMFEGIAQEFTGDEARRFLRQSNPWALNAIAERLLEAEQRGLWVPKPQTSAGLRAVLLESEATIEEHSEDLVGATAVGGT